MSTTILKLTPQDPIIARDGRPFGDGQGSRMRSLSWPLPSVVAGSFRTALVKASDRLTFDNGMPEKLLNIEVAGVFPTVGSELYLPAPGDAIAEPTEDRKRIKAVHRLTPQPADGGCDFPEDLPLQPVMLSEQPASEDFKPAEIPAWWPLSRYVDWLTSKEFQFTGDWFTDQFLNAAAQETRDHVAIDEQTGAAKESHIFSTTGLNVSYLPRFEVKDEQPFRERFAETTLSARVTVQQNDAGLRCSSNFNTLHPLGGERRLVHWQASDKQDLWNCPEAVRLALSQTNKVRMILTTPAVFADGWKPRWLNERLEGIPPGTDVKLKLVGVGNNRWKAVSGWSLAPLRGPKAIRRMVPAGSVYFFQKVEGDGGSLATNGWLRPVSDALQDRNDGFGLAVWGTW